MSHLARMIVRTAMPARDGHVVIPREILDAARAIVAEERASEPPVVRLGPGGDFTRDWPAGPRDPLDREWEPPERAPIQGDGSYMFGNRYTGL